VARNLRIIYGLEYTAAENLERLRSRRLAGEYEFRFAVGLSRVHKRFL